MVGLSWLFFKSCEPHRLEAEPHDLGADSPIRKHTSTVENNSNPAGTGAAADAWSNGSLGGYSAQDLS